MQQTPNSVFLELQDGTALTYQDANVLSARLANRLESIGLLAGDRVTCQCEKSYRVVILYLACLRAGLVFHPLNSAYTLSELEYFLIDAEPSLIVCESDQFSATKELANRVGISQIMTLDLESEDSVWVGLERFADEFDPVFRKKDDLALLIYTSGTTGKPKGAMITQENISSNTASLVDIWHWRSDDVLLHVLPLFHVHGLCVGLHCPMLRGSCILFHDKFSVQNSLSQISNATIMMAVPTIYTRLLSQPELTRSLCQSIRLFISGSAPLLPETFAEFEQRTGLRILERYGMTEAQMITSNPVDGARVPGTVGYSLPDIRLRVVEENGKLIASGQTGILEIKGPNVFAGYWRNPEASKEAFRRDGYFITGDFATIDNSNRVTIVGRHSDLIISAGLNVYPREVEIALNNLPWIVDSAVFGVPHSDLGEAVVAAVIQRDEEKSICEIKAELKSQISEFKIPKKVIFMQDFPRNAMGKIQKNRLREIYKSIFINE